MWWTDLKRIWIGGYSFIINVTEMKKEYINNNEAKKCEEKRAQ